MSGSGSAFFGIFKSKKDAVFAAKRIRARGIKAIATVTV
jgi:4-diphosphocytidyl-2C-methyl-D-erythritol kinase